MVARAIQKYGMVLVDTAGSIDISCQSPQSANPVNSTNPYDALFHGLPSYSVLNGIPWDQLQVIDPSYRG